MDVVPISAAFSGFMVLTNVSLRYNSVGVYQIFKILTSPTICIELFFYSQSLLFSSFIASPVSMCGVRLQGDRTEAALRMDSRVCWRRLPSFLGLCVGNDHATIGDVWSTLALEALSSSIGHELFRLKMTFDAGYTSVSDVEFNFKGTAIAAIATVVTSCYQIWTNTCQKQLGCSSMQARTCIWTVSGHVYRHVDVFVNAAASVPSPTLVVDDPGAHTKPRGNRTYTRRIHSE